MPYLLLTLAALFAMMVVFVPLVRKPQGGRADPGH